jgi:hypothetical protein
MIPITGESNTKMGIARHKSKILFEIGIRGGVEFVATKEILPLKPFGLKHRRRATNARLQS